MGFLDDLFKKKKPATKPDFSGVRSGQSSTAAAPPAAGPPLATPPATLRTYVVVKGDNLSKIAKSHYGNPNEWRKIYEANRDTIKDPDLIQPGQLLRIP